MLENYYHDSRMNTVLKKTYIPRMTSTLVSYWCVSLVFYESNASKMARIALWMTEKKPKIKTKPWRVWNCVVRSATSRVGTIAYGSGFADLNGSGCCR